MASGILFRKEIADDTLSRSEGVTAMMSNLGATSRSTFIPRQLPPLDSAASPSLAPSKVVVINEDSFTVARSIMDEDPRALGKTAVLNLASDKTRAGGWLESLWTTQEEALCYSSTLYSTLTPSFYPWPNLGPKSIAGIWSPGIVIFKHNLSHNCVDILPTEWRVVSVISVAAPRYPKLTSNKTTFLSNHDLEDLRGKIRLVYRMAATNSKECLVLGAMGCGAYACPPRLVAEEMKVILMEPEFKGWFRRIVFAVFSRRDNGGENFNIFKEVFDGVEV